MKQLVLIRHGESAWNQENRFTGWVDVGLSEKGLGEARAAGQALRAAGVTFDAAFTSLLRRAITADEDLPLTWLNLGVCLQAQGKVPEAAVAYREALRLQPDFAQVRIYLNQIQAK